MLITPLYAAIFGLMFVGLSVRTLLLRRKFEMAIGYGNHAVLARASRVIGMSLTLMVIIATCLRLLINYLFKM